MDYTKELVNSVLIYPSISCRDDVKHKAKLCVLDYVANIYGSLELDAVRSVVDFVRSLGGPEAATALGCGFKTGLQNAAFINGTTAEAIEAQDGLRFGGNHPVSAVIPAAFAVAESMGLAGDAPDRGRGSRVRGGQQGRRGHASLSYAVRVSSPPAPAAPSARRSRSRS